MKDMKRVLALLILFVLCPGTGFISNAKDFSAIVDMAGRQVTLPVRPARVICLGPGALRLIVYLRATKRVVGVEDIEKRFPLSRPYWIANSFMRHLPSIGPGGPAAINKMPDMESVLRVKPDIIFATYMAPQKADQIQSRLGIPVVVLSYGREGTIGHELYGSLALAGKALGLEQRASEVISCIEGERKHLLSLTKAFPEMEKPSVYAGCVGYRGLHGIGSTEASYLPFEWVRARNVAKNLRKEGHVFVSREQILAWNPQVIFIDSAGLELLKEDLEKKQKFYEGLKAFKAGNVYTLFPYNWYATNVGTAIIDAYAVAKVLYPKTLGHVKLHGKANEVYGFLVGAPLYSKMVKIHGRLLRELAIRN